MVFTFLFACQALICSTSVCGERIGCARRKPQVTTDGVESLRRHDCGRPHGTCLLSAALTASVIVWTGMAPNFTTVSRLRSPISWQSYVWTHNPLVRSLHRNSGNPFCTVYHSKDWVTLSWWVICLKRCLRSKWRTAVLPSEIKTYRVHYGIWLRARYCHDDTLVLLLRGTLRPDQTC